MKKLFLIFAILFSTMVHGNTENCFPKNNRSNPITVKSTMTITEADFSASIAQVKAIYCPIFKNKYKANLVVEEKWKDNTVNAYATQSGKDWNVTMFGGLARDPLVTKDGFIAVICHEIGHHVGGSPRKGFGWASNEGQADYFATEKCLKKVFESEKEFNLKVFNADLTEDQKLAKAACEGVYAIEEEQALCFRSSMAGESLAKLLGSLGGNSNVKFGTPDPTVVTKTNHNHPKGQCRMDTFFQGALCDKDHNIWPSNSDASEGYCTSKDNYKIGLRPLCWFKPSEYDLER
jgi:hypothetical protein